MKMVWEMCIRDSIYGEQVATVAATGNKNFNRFMGWADAARQLLVMTCLLYTSRCV